MISFFRRLFGRKTIPEDEPTPPRPDDWNLTLKDLFREMDEGKRKSLGQPEMEWAREYEASLIPEDYRFPHKGDLYESKKEQVVDYLTSWAAPFTGGDKTTIYPGERFWIDSEPIFDKPISSYAMAVDYDALERRIVPSSDRNAPKYGGFYFSFDTVVLNEDFELIQTGYDPKG